MYWHAIQNASWRYSSGYTNSLICYILFCSVPDALTLAVLRDKNLKIYIYILKACKTKKNALDK